ncbi:hypothetical protein EUGRSUZ_L03308 [Eucalyptus grandis]|uniref:Uncharacterized protein n=1 Tax=Eucalyptus grandis TaxID=71139 RepID=A0AAD9T8Z9_EUCGR|nr:hypothetical protein EUGRSUZ_L03308 [Eucalyptus grandis]
MINLAFVISLFSSRPIVSPPVLDRCLSATRLSLSADNVDHETLTFYQGNSTTTGATPKGHGCFLIISINHG